jgi:type 1 glutamine amidotransferase
VGISTPKYRLSSVSSAVLTLLTWGLTNAQSPPTAQAARSAETPPGTQAVRGAQTQPTAQASRGDQTPPAAQGARGAQVTRIAQASPGAQAPADIPKIPGQNPTGLQVYLRAGLKTHGPGLHDYPQFLADWSKFLTEHGAVVSGSLHAPLAEELSKTAVLVIYKGDAGYLSDEDRKALEAFIERGGGIVSIHDALCGPDPTYFATLVGGAKKHGEVNYTLEANVPYTVVDSGSPLMKDIAGITLRDEAFFNMTWASNPRIHVLATTVIDGTPSAGTHKGEVVPQIWTYEHSLAGGQPARAFVWMQGHEYANFAQPQIQNMLLRAIAWAGRHPVDELVDYRPPPRPQGPPGAQPPATQPLQQPSHQQ